MVNCSHLIRCRFVLLTFTRSSFSFAIRAFRRSRHGPARPHFVQPAQPAKLERERSCDHWPNGSHLPHPHRSSSLALCQGLVSEHKHSRRRALLTFRCTQVYRSLGDQGQRREGLGFPGILHADPGQSCRYPRGKHRDWSRTWM